MKLTRFAGVAVILALCLGISGSAAAQSNVTSADIQRLQDTIYDASRDISQVRSRDQALASQLQAELDDARDEAAYLKVKLRRNEPIARSEYSDVRDRIENIRSRARGDSARLASGDRIGRQPLGRRGGLSGQRHRRAGEDVGTATSCTRHRLNRNGDHDRLSHSGKAVQSRTGVHPEYR